MFISFYEKEKSCDKLLYFCKSIYKVYKYVINQDK